MKIGKIIFAGAAAFLAACSSAFAQSLTGGVKTITKLEKQ